MKQLFKRIGLCALVLCLLAGSATAREDALIDLDLSSLSGTVVYSQVYQMMCAPEDYLGLIVRVRGNFSYFQDEETLQEYFAAVIPDATACCAQGIEFIWEGEHEYPMDYPEPGGEITITGRFETYEESGYLYIRLADARLEWDEESPDRG